LRKAERPRGIGPRLALGEWALALGSVCLLPVPGALRGEVDEVSKDRAPDRLGYSPEGLQHWLLYVGIARICLLAFVTVGATFIQAQVRAEFFLPLFSFGFITSLWFLHTAREQGAVGRPQSWAQVLVDFSVVAVTVGFTHGLISYFTFLFVVVVLEAGLLLGLRQGVILATMASAFMVYQARFSSEGMAGLGTSEIWYNVLVQCFAFYLTAFMSGYWNQRINQMRRFQQEILNNMNSGFLITDESGLVTVINNAAREILKVDEKTCMGAPVEEVLRVASGRECPVRTALRSGSDFTSYEFGAIKGTGERLLLGLTTNRITEHDGQTAGLIASFTDLTEMSTLREEIRRQDRLAIVGELSAGLAHEIRNPVAVIRGAVDELGAAGSDVSLDRKLREMVIRESDHLNEIVSGFLDFAREPSMDREVFDLGDVVEEVAALLSREYSGPEGCLVEVSCPLSASPVSGNRSQIKQVFVNLGRNSIEAMNGGGKLGMMVLNGPGPREVRFEDEGPGIAPDEVARIFEPFYTTKKSGVGMGLAVCSRIMTAHDGTIRASSRSAGGCTMTVRFPAALGGE